LISMRISSRMLASSAESGSSSSSTVGLEHDGAGKRDALLLAARQLRRQLLLAARQAAPSRARVSTLRAISVLGHIRGI
jgi:hypothetical protein